MNEHITRYFYPDNTDEEINILDLRKSIREMNECVYANIMGRGDYHHIEALFKIPFKFEGE